MCTGHQILAPQHVAYCVHKLTFATTALLLLPMLYLNSCPAAQMTCIDIHKGRGSPENKMSLPQSFNSFYDRGLFPIYIKKAVLMKRARAQAPQTPDLTLVFWSKNGLLVRVWVLDEALINTEQQKEWSKEKQNSGKRQLMKQFIREQVQQTDSHTVMWLYYQT